MTGDSEGMAKYLRKCYVKYAVINLLMVQL